MTFDREQLEDAPLDPPDLVCTFQRWQPPGCFDGAGLLTFCGSYPPGAPGKGHAAWIQWRIDQVVDLPTLVPLAGLVIDCRELEYVMGDDLSLSPTRQDLGLWLFLVLRESQRGAYDYVLPQDAEVFTDLDAALDLMDQRVRAIAEETP